MKQFLLGLCLLPGLMAAAPREKKAVECIRFNQPAVNVLRAATPQIDSSYTYSEGHLQSKLVYAYDEEGKVKTTYRYDYRSASNSWLFLGKTEYSNHTTDEYGGYGYSTAYFAWTEAGEWEEQTRFNEHFLASGLQDVMEEFILVDGQWVCDWSYRGTEYQDGLPIAMVDSMAEGQNMRDPKVEVDIEKGTITYDAQRRPVTMKDYAWDPEREDWLLVADVTLEYKTPTGKDYVISGTMLDGYDELYPYYYEYTYDRYGNEIEEREVDEDGDEFLFQHRYFYNDGTVTVNESVAAAPESSWALTGAGTLVVTTSTPQPFALYSISGKMIYNKQLAAGRHEIPVQPLARGIYLIRVGEQSGKVKL